MDVGRAETGKWFEMEQRTDVDVVRDRPRRLQQPTQGTRKSTGTTMQRETTTSSKQRKVNGADDVQRRDVSHQAQPRSRRQHALQGQQQQNGTVTES